MSSNHPKDLALDCEAIEELIPDYAFGLTTPEETRLVEAGLVTCPDAVTQLADFRRMQDDMRADVAQVAPSAALEARLMAAIAEPAASPVSVPVTAQPRRRWISPAWLAAAAAVVALVWTNVSWRSQNDALTTQLNQISDRLNRPLVWTSTSRVKTVRLPASVQDEQTTAYLMWNAESAMGLLYAEGFPELEEGNTYQLWLTRGEEKVSAGTFRVDEQGKGALLFRITEPIDQYTWARITDEPESGSPEPTGPVLVNGEI